jgi:hypothetical protein
VDGAASLAFLVDGATATAALFNTAALNARRGDERVAVRRSALLALSALCAGVVVQAAFSQAMFAAHRAGQDVAPFFATDAWVASKALLLAGTLLMALIIVRSPA